MTTPKVLVIAGSDSSGGAGLEADQRTLAAHGCYAMTATTALTAQNTLGVEDVHVTPPAFVGKQIREVMEDGFMEGEPGVVKMGMLASAETIKVVAETLQECQENSGKELKIVLDPVMVATSGAQLLQGDAVRNLRELLLPMTHVLTPNIPEATLLLRDADIKYRTPSNLEDLKALAKTLHSLGPKHILLKGGHMSLTKSYTKATTNADKAITVDILYPSSSIPSSSSNDQFTIIESPYLTIPNTHGTGCSLASSLAANIATPPTQPLSDSVRNAIRYVSHGILSSPTLQSTLHNKGPGPINHFHSLILSPFPIGSFIEYLLSHPRIAPIWDAYINHPFTHALGSGTLPVEIFKSYLIQDYLYLTHFARTYALAAYKSQYMSSVVRSAEIILHIQKEMQLHLRYCEEFGISKEEIESTPESMACTAYSRYVLDVGMSGDVLALYVSLAPCLIGYGIVAERLANTPGYVKTKDAKDGKEGNRYWKWVENYTADDYREAVVKGREVIEEEVRRQGGLGKGRAEELVEVFRRAAKMEVGFWELDAHTGMAERAAES